MRSKRVAELIGRQAEGEQGVVIVGGVLPPRGATIYETGLTMLAPCRLRCIEVGTVVGPVTDPDFFLITAGEVRSDQPVPQLGRRESLHVGLSTGAAP